jgi:hypothetical protein
VDTSSIFSSKSLVSTESFSVGKLDFEEIVDLDILREILENDVIRENG